jgi:hypothetical protein
VCASVDVDVEVASVLPVEKVTVTRVLRDSGWVSLGEEAGQSGCSFWGLVGVEWVEGVREGTQKEGRVGLAAWGGGVSLRSFWWDWVCSLYWGREKGKTNLLLIYLPPNPLPLLQHPPPHLPLIKLKPLLPLPPPPLIPPTPTPPRLKVPNRLLPLLHLLIPLHLLRFPPLPPLLFLKPLNLLSLRQQVLHRAFPAEHPSAAGARAGGAGGLQAEEAGAEGEEGVAAEAGGARAPGGAEEGALVGGEEGEGGVALGVGHFRAWKVVEGRSGEEEVVNVEGRNESLMRVLENLGLLLGLIAMSIAHGISRGNSIDGRLFQSWCP